MRSSNETRMDNQIEGNDFAVLIRKLRLFHVDCTNFFAH
jgi:hypothetical protein